MAGKLCDLDRMSNGGNITSWFYGNRILQIVSQLKVLLVPVLARKQVIHHLLHLLQGLLQQLKYLKQLNEDGVHLSMKLVQIKRNRVRKYGYSLHGKPLQTHRMFIRGDQVSAIT